MVNENAADPAEIGSYEITSASTALDASKWSSLADQAVVPDWGELIANDDYVAENTNSPTGFSAVPATGFNLGQLFRPGGAHDLVFSYGDETNNTFGGTVNYVTGAGSAQVVGRQTFYNNSGFDGGDPAATPADDAAVDPGKQALLPGRAAGFGNITSYARGINGITVDVKGLPSEVQLAPTDFAFRTGSRATAAGPGSRPA